MRILNKVILCGLALLPVAAAADDFEETLSVPFGGTLRIELPAGSIDVDTHDEELVEIDADLTGGMELEITQRGDEVTVSGRARGGLLGFLQLGRIRVHARVPERFPGLKYNLTAMVCQATGGPCVYTGLSMKDSHAALNISEADWKLFEADCVATLEEFGVPEAEQQELFAIINSTMGDIVVADPS